MNPIALHRTFEGDPGSKQSVFYIAEGDKVKRLTGAKAVKWIENFQGTLRVTQAHSTDVQLLDLARRGVSIVTAHWHSTGIPKNLSPEDIAQRFAALPDTSFRPFTPRPDLSQLRKLVDSRFAIIEHRKADTNRLTALRRTFGIEDGEELTGPLKIYADELNTDRRKVETPLDKSIADHAKTILECVAFNDAAGIADGWNTAAPIVAYLGDLSRFPTVSSLWHYCGQHVVDGKAPKRTRGVAGDWSPRLRTVLWNLGTSIIKNTNNRWRVPYEQFLAAELAVHEQKHPGCPTIQGHCGARARRRIVKEILKEFYISASNNQGTSETQNTPVV